MSEPEAPTPPSPPPPETPSSGGGSSNRGIMIVLSYLGILALIPLLVEKEDREVQWHAKHGLVLTVTWVALFIVLSILAAVLGSVTMGFAGCGIAVLELILGLGILVVHIICIVKGINGERFTLPVVSEFADKF